jgi:hypothetical protein
LAFMVAVPGWVLSISLAWVTVVAPSSGFPSGQYLSRSLTRSPPTYLVAIV